MKKVTPCCKTTKWRFPYRDDLPDNNFDNEIVVCLLCDKEFSKELLETVKKGFNPTTYFCDKCHKSLREEHITNLHNNK